MAKLALIEASLFAELARLTALEASVAALEATTVALDAIEASDAITALLGFAAATEFVNEASVLALI